MPRLPVRSLDLLLERSTCLHSASRPHGFASGHWMGNTSSMTLLAGAWMASPRRKSPGRLARNSWCWTLLPRVYIVFDYTCNWRSEYDAVAEGSRCSRPADHADGARSGGGIPAPAGER